MKILLVFIAMVFVSGCITGNPWQQFMHNSENRWKDKNYFEVREEMLSIGREEITPKEGYILPNGNRQHEFFWGERESRWSASNEKVSCTLIFEVDTKRNAVVLVGAKGGLYACFWGG